MAYSIHDSRFTLLPTPGRPKAPTLCPRKSLIGAPQRRLLLAVARVLLILPQLKDRNRRPKGQVHHPRLLLRHQLNWNARLDIFAKPPMVQTSSLAPTYVSTALRKYTVLCGVGKVGRKYRRQQESPSEVYLKVGERRSKQMATTKSLPCVICASV